MSNKETFKIHRPEHFTTNGWPNYITAEKKDGRLSYQSIMILLYLAGQDLTKFKPRRKVIMEYAGIKSETTWSKCLRELKKCGYLVVHKWTDPKTKRYQTEYELFLDPLDNEDFNGELPKHYFDREEYYQKRMQRKSAALSRETKQRKETNINKTFNNSVSGNKKNPRKTKNKIIINDNVGDFDMDGFD